MKKIKIPKLHPTIHLAAAAVLFIVATIASRQAPILGWEESLFLSIFNWPDFLRLPFIFITWFGSIQVFAIIALALVYLRKSAMLIRFLMVSSMAYLLSGVGKSIWGSTRPDELLNIVTRDFSYGPGYPSGHTALAVAMALVIGHYLPKKYHWVVVVWIVGVGLSRIYLGVHAPLDIVGGFAIGWFSYMLIRHVRLTPIKFGARKKKRKVAYTNTYEKKSKKRTTK